MSNIHGLFSNRDDDDDDKDDSNNRFVGGIGDRGGGSGLAVQPNNNNDDDGGDDDGGGGGRMREAIFGLAEHAGGGGGSDGAGGGAPSERPRRTITMYRSGFVVDDGPYRRLDDPANAQFLRALAQGQTPAELLMTPDGSGGGGASSASSSSADMAVGLIDKRHEEYVETFRHFSGTGNSLGSAPTTTTTTTNTDGSTTTTNNNNGGVLDPSTFPSEAPTVDVSQPTTSIQVRLMNGGGRRIIQINESMTVLDLAVLLSSSASATTTTTQSYTLSSGFPPRTITNVQQTVVEAGLKGAQVIQKPAP